MCYFLVHTNIHTQPFPTACSHTHSLQCLPVSPSLSLIHMHCLAERCLSNICLSGVFPLMPWLVKECSCFFKPPSARDTWAEKKKKKKERNRKKKNNNNLLSSDLFPLPYTPSLLGQTCLSTITSAKNKTSMQLNPCFWDCPIFLDPA